MQLTLIDTSGIQDFVFGSNRLKENIGGSALVDMATRDWVEEQCSTLDSQGTIIYCGGGNALLCFDDDQKREVFVREYSRRILCDAPGLRLLIESVAFDVKKDPLYGRCGKLLELQRKLSIAKQAAPVSQPLLGLGVSAVCRSTGLPAVGVARGPDGDFPASAETLGRLAVSGSANQRLKQRLDPGSGFEYPDELDDMGRSHGEHSFIAIVHADGDGMGKRVKSIVERENWERSDADPVGNDAFCKALGAFSKSIDQAANTALNKVLDLLRANIDTTHGSIGDISSGVTIDLQKRNGVFLLPFRPIVSGGDDLTFVCDGRLGIQLAYFYLNAFQEACGSDDKLRGATACAGVAIVKSHYPFARAYELAEALCKNAKVYKKDQNIDCGCIDWHLAVSGLNSELGQIRRREYETPYGSLTTRPVSTDQSERSWKTIHKGIEAFRGPGWKNRRNKLKALRDVLRDGPDAVKQFITHYNEGNPLPVVFASNFDWSSCGWQGKHCGYFDALELEDTWIDLSDAPQAMREGGQP